MGKTAMLAEQVELACTHFIGTYAEALPRVARRGLQPVLDLYEQLGKSRNAEATSVPLFMYSTENGLRTELVSEATESIVTIRYNLESHEFERSAFMLAHAVPGGLFLPANPVSGWRVVTLEDIRELGITPVELAQFIQLMCQKAAEEDVLSMATQKPAQA